MDGELVFTRVAGVSHYQDALSRCVPGEPVRFVHEPDNPYDQMAIRIETVLGETIGYVPRASPIHRLVHERGRGIAGVIDSVGLSRACLLGARVSMSITDDPVRPASYYPDRPAPEEPQGGFRYWVREPVRKCVPLVT